MAYCGFYNGMAAASSSIAAFDCASGGVAIGEVDSYGEFRWYGQAQNSSLGRQICKKGRQQPRYKDMYRPPTPPRSRSRSCSRSQDVAGLTSSMGGLSVSGCDSRMSRSESVRRPSMSGNSSRPSRSQSVRSRPLARAPSAPPAVRDFKYKPLVSAAAPRSRSRSRADPLPAAPPRSRSRSRAGPPPARQLQRAPSQGGSGKGAKGARSAGWVRKFVSGI
ncbi:hypothetical protein LTR70_001474 [Exophiala xenobiotica]|uniref:Uncharacterized protein n=1 Tax=Lithohypha guttulata TaxID=1690604 RepID=A0ABR0KGY2_9EURO|nr:hypothetical protein LTR24_002764 [Lithohypha guttulata]KAK5327851.1 hypothetical protein LTR70_001474 [Exophiala xenobiotica]